ncbi:MAG: DedA family protein [Phycisphaerales bacterium]|nr:DedA family protein [Phycisphaerales bacterium]
MFDDLSLTISNNIGEYGPWLVFFLLYLSGVGIPLGEDIIIIPAGMLIGQGQFGWFPMVPLTYLGVVLADVTWFGICRTFGMKLLRRRLIKRLVHPRRMLEMKYKFDHYGVWVVVVSRFIPASRTTMITVVGAFRMKFWKFLVAEAVCVAVTLPFQLGLGYLIGAGMPDTKNFVDLLIKIAVVVLVVLVAVFLFGLWMRSRKSDNRAPRAPIAWLKRGSTYDPSCVAELATRRSQAKQ